MEKNNFLRLIRSVHNIYILYIYILYIYIYIYKNIYTLIGIWPCGLVIHASFSDRINMVKLFFFHLYKCEKLFHLYRFRINEIISAKILKSRIKFL